MGSLVKSTKVWVLLIGVFILVLFAIFFLREKNASSYLSDNQSQKVSDAERFTESQQTGQQEEKKTLEQIISEMVDFCMKNYEDASVDYCYDISYYSLARHTGNLTFCEKIKTNVLRERCFR